MRQKWSRQKYSHAEMFAEELPTRMPTYVPTRMDPVPAILPPKFFNRVVYYESIVREVGLHPNRLALIAINVLF